MWRRERRSPGTWSDERIGRPDFYIVKTIATIEARMNSSRLPGKVMLPILGQPALQLLVERLHRAKGLDGIVIATTTHPADAVIERLAAKLGVGCFRGSEQDVLERVLLSGAKRAGGRDRGDHRGLSAA